MVKNRERKPDFGRNQHENRFSRKKHKRIIQEAVGLEKYHYFEKHWTSFAALFASVIIAATILSFLMRFTPD